MYCISPPYNTTATNNICHKNNSAPYSMN
jgi:hypothetical protein